MEIKNDDPKLLPPIFTGVPPVACGGVPARVYQFEYTEQIKNSEPVACSSNPLKCNSKRTPPSCSIKHSILTKGLEIKLTERVIDAHVMSLL